MNLLVHTEVTINETDSGNLVISNYQSLVIRQQVFGLNSYELVVDESIIEGIEADFMKKSAKLIGKKTSVKITMPGGSPEVIFKGIVTNVSCNNSENNTSISIKAESPEVLMSYGIKKKVFNDMSVKDIAQKIAATYPSSHIDFNNTAFGLATSLKTTIIQYNESDYQFLQRLADVSGNWFFNDGLKTHFGKAPDGNAVELNAGLNLSYFEVNARAGGIQHEAEVFNPKDDAVVNKKSIKPNTDNLTSTILSETEKSFSNKNTYHAPKFLENADLLGKYLEVRYNQQVSELNTVSGTSCETKVKLGNKIKIVRGDSTIGEYRVVSLETMISAEGNYSNHFTGVAFSEHAPQKMSANPPIPSEMRGKVVAVNDPDGHGRVKVRFDWQSNNEEFGWLQVSSPSSGNDSGFYMRPEVGSWVIIHLAHTIGLWDSYVVGAMHHGKAQPKRWKDKDNNIKGIKTEKGNEILLEDKGKDGKAISIQTSDDDSNYFWIVDNNGTTEIYLRSKGIKLMAENDLEISAGGKLILQGTDVKISSGKTTVSKDSVSQGAAMATIELKSAGDLTIDTKTKFNANATTEIKLASMGTFTASATATFEVDAKVSTTLKSTGVLTIQGSLVKIN